MVLLLLEALLALFILIGIVWWTMFAGRPKGELPPELPAGRPSELPPPAGRDPEAGPSTDKSEKKADGGQ